MALRDPNTLDLTQQKLRIAQDVMFWPVRERGELVYRIEIPSLHRFFRVGYEEYVFISLIDGKTTIPQACGLAAAKLGSRAPTAAQAGAIARWLLKNELAFLEAEGPPVRRLSAAEPGTHQNAAARWLGRLNPFWMKIPLPQVERLINRAAKIFRPLLDTRAVLVAIVLIVAAAVVLFSRWHEFASSSVSLVHPSNWLWLLATWTVLKLVHELAHAVACERQGGTVHQSGIVLVLFAPLAYVDVTSCWRMNSRWSRIAVAAAGMYLEVLIAAAAVLLWAWIDAPQAKFLLHNLVLTAGLSTLLFNANVLMRFDGYFILADLIEVPNLYAESSSALQRFSKRILTGERSSEGSLGGWRRHFVLGYGIAAFLWRVTICVSLAAAASTMFAGAGIVIAAMGITMWLGRPLRALVRFATDLRAREPHRLMRGIVIGLTAVCTLAVFFFWVPIPTAIRVPAVGRYLPETIVRSRASGFVVKVHAEDGSLVEQGDILVELENKELSNRLAQLQITREQNEIRLRQALEKHDAGERQVLVENQSALAEQIEQLQLQADAMRVMSPRRGRIVARGLRAKLGTYISEGDSILSVAAEQDKEIIAMIPQQVVEEVRFLVGRQIRVRTAGFDVESGRLDRVEPRADVRLSERSLAATEGGTLAVEAAAGGEGQEEVVLLEPYFRGRIALQADVAGRVPAGMRMQAWMGYRTDTVASRARQSIRRLWHAARDMSAAQ